MQTPRVFISYSHDTTDHKDRVRDLAGELRRNGCDVRLDQYESTPDEGWQRWMTVQVEQADVVLLVCTETFKRRFEGNEKPGVGRGADFEGLLTSQRLYENTRKHRIIPVLFPPETERAVPMALRSFGRYSLPEEFAALLRHIFREPLVVPPPIVPRVTR